MRLIYDSERFIPIMKRLRKEEINENGSELNFSYYSKERIVFDKKDEEKTIFLSSTALNSYNKIKSFTTDKKNPGVIFISNRTYLNYPNVVNKILLDKTIKLKNLILLGQHVIRKPELEFINQHNLHLFSMKELSHEGCFEISESIMSIAKQFSDLYIFVDSNVLEYPTIKTSWAGGMTTRELIFFIQRFKHSHNLRTVELLISPMDSRVAVKLLAELYV